MRVVDRLAQREESWRELEALLDGARDLKHPARNKRLRVPAAEVLRLGELYRAACSDLMLAEAHDLPRDMVAYLHALVGRAHNALYRAQGFRFADWARALFGTVPRQLRADPALRLAALVFFGSFVFCGLLAAGRPGVRREVDRRRLRRTDGANVCGAARRRAQGRPTTQRYRDGRILYPA